VKPTRVDYCQFLLSSQINYTLTYHAEHHAHFSHDAIKRYLQDEKLTARLVWENARTQLVPSPNGYLVFDDSVADKDHSFNIELVRRQYSGNEHRVIKGIGLVNCIYVNPDLNQYWVVDYRIFDPDSDGKTKLEHVREMLINAVADKQLPFLTVLMDTWYATKELMLLIEKLHKVYYCPLKDNRLVDDSGAQAPYRHVDSLQWSPQELEHGKTIKIKTFPNKHKVKLFRVVVSSHRTDWIVTNNLAQNSTDATQKVCRIRWKIEQFHRELKQVTGLEACQCRKARIQRNHIACAMLVWNRLAAVARRIGRTVYHVKRSLLDNYLCQELRNPAVRMELV
jgi:hypothetical protein